MITELTKEQEARIPEFVEKWTAIGLRTDPMRYGDAELSIHEAYKDQGYAAPKEIIFVPSPWQLVFAPALWHNEIPDPLDKKLEDRFRSDALDQLSKVVYGNGNAWLSYYDYFINACGASIPEVMGLLKVARTCHWWLPYENVAFVSDFPNQINRDERYRPHNLEGPALAYNDGFSIFSVGGVRVPEYVIMRPHEISVKKIDDEQNAEVRRVMIEKYGSGKYLLDSKAKAVSKDKYGILYRRELDGDEPIQMVYVEDSTDPEQTYFIRVPPDVRTAKQAVAWTFWENEDEYAPEVET